MEERWALKRVGLEQAEAAAAVEEEANAQLRDMVTALELRIMMLEDEKSGVGHG